MTTATIEEAQANLAGLIAELKPGEEVLITQRDRPVARLVVEPPNTRPPRQPGSAIGKLAVVEDDDTHLGAFKEYMP
ncbi:MAG: type II toxin-antitoxin system prevent-host-death family antitoxin [Planctomycetes bacterium]|nr:type II toxin-antitoxin system prevent-host-death family antitoxin [Planctomycetota bacterium]